MLSRGIFAAIGQYLFLTSNTNMHNAMTEKISRATILFFDSNPSGRISTRFTKDMLIMDSAIPSMGIFVSLNILRIITVVVSVSTVNPFLLIVGFVALIIIRYLYNLSMKAMIEAKRFNIISLGPINSILSMSINGLVTMRAYRKFDFFTSKFMDAIEYSTNANFSFHLVNRWTGVRLDYISVFFGFMTCLISVLSKGRVDKTMLVISI